MNYTLYKEIRIKIDAAAEWTLYSGDAGSYSPDQYVLISEGISGIPARDDGISGAGDVIRYNSGYETEGVSLFALTENIRYCWDLGTAESICEFESPVQGKKNCEWHKGRKNSGDFLVRNYLGSSHIGLKNADIPFFRFDVISKKLDYYTEYRRLVEAIAAECSQLLMDWDSPTSFRFSSDAGNDKPCLLEQFLFIRHVLKPDNLALYLEVVSRNPDTRFADDPCWTNSASAGAGAEFFADPVNRGRDWIKTTSGGVFLPGEILTSNRYETLDTPANRLIYHALTGFRNVCNCVIESAAGGRYSSVRMEAQSMIDLLDLFLAQPFFREVEALSYIPHNSQVLQKREGYRQIYHAWLMLEAASRLDWAGLNDVYEGSNRDAALLYEYWLFFVLYRVIRSIDSLYQKESGNPGEDPDFIKTHDSGLLLSLKSGETSRICFCSDKINLTLYYNRTFSAPSGIQNGSNQYFQRGSYSRILRPDYSIAVFPSSMDEAEAELKGLTAWIHFDAKYRVDNYNFIFGEDSTADPENALEQEKQESAYSTYKRGDLYKMHTYNEAIRRTVGSYVLYPGKPQNGKGKQFYKYQEILPGVGAFPVTPSPDDGGFPEGADALKDFIKNIITHQIDKFSDYYRINYWTNKSVVRDVHAGYLLKNETPPADICTGIIPVRSDAVYERCREVCFFYCHAEYEHGKKNEMNLNLLKAGSILPVMMETGIPFGEIYSVINIDTVSGEELVVILGKGFSRGTASRYYRFHVSGADKIETSFKLDPPHRPGIASIKIIMKK